MKRHLMLDLETAGANPGCPILSIGAVVFTQAGLTGQQFHQHINYEDSLKEGFKPEFETSVWWGQQEQAVYDEAFSGILHPGVVIANFIDWLSLQAGHIDEVWANGSDFDFPILQFAINKYNYRKAWEYYNQRDYRTLRKYFDYVKPPTENKMKHNALADAKHQAEHLICILNWIERCKNGV